MSSFVSRVVRALGDWLWPPKITLPQKAGRSGKWQRRRQLAAAREDYQFNYTHVSSLAIAHEVPILDHLHFKWLTTVVNNVLVALENRALLEFSTDAAKCHRERHGKLRRLVDR